jgi:4-hydroxybenzoate polyprenyltransferase
VGAVLMLLWLVALGIGVAFVRNPRPGAGRAVEAMAGAWTLVVYLSLGIAPWVFRHG